VRLRRLRSGELLALAGAICLIVALTEPWYEAQTGNLSAWNTFGPAVVLLLIDLLAAIAVALSALAERSPGPPVFAAVWSVPIGLVGVVAAIVRVLERPDHASGLCAGAWLALAGSLIVLAGGWQTLRDEHGPLYAAPPIEPTELDVPASLGPGDRDGA
jgi:fatty acid desaturase